MKIECRFWFWMYLCAIMTLCIDDSFPTSLHTTTAMTIATHIYFQTKTLTYLAMAIPQLCAVRLRMRHTLSRLFSLSLSHARNHAYLNLFRTRFNCGLWFGCTARSWNRSRSNYKLALNFDKPVHSQISTGVNLVEFITTSAKIHAVRILEIFLTASSAARPWCHKLAQWHHIFFLSFSSRYVCLCVLFRKFIVYGEREFSSSLLR